VVEILKNNKAERKELSLAPKGGKPVRTLPTKPKEEKRYEAKNRILDKNNHPKKRREEVRRTG